MKTLLVSTLIILGFTVNATGTFAPPVANAGPDQTIYLTQTSTVTLNGSASSGSSYQWSDVSTDYKSGATITSPNSAVTTVTGLKQGTWYYQLAVTSGGVTTTDEVVIRVDYDTPPSGGSILRGFSDVFSAIKSTVNQRNDITSFIETSVSTVTGNVFFDRPRLPDEYIDPENGKFYSTIEDGYAWNGQAYARSEVHYQGSSWNAGKGIDSNQTYVFEWKGYFPQDFSYLASNSNVTVIFQIHGNDPYSPPFQFVANSVKGLSFFEDPQGGNGGKSNTTILSLSDLVNKTHTIRLTVREGMGYAGQDGFVKVEVDGVQKYLRNTGRVGATFGYDYPKFATLYDWGKALVDPGNKTRGRKFSLVTEAFNIFQLTNNQSPQANAGSDQTISLPDNTVSLSGSGKDPDGTIKSYHWDQMSGPSTASIVNSSSAATNVNGLMEGTYQFQLTVTDDDGTTGKATVTITVKSATNNLPVADAGSDQNITLPESNISLSGKGTDSDGAIGSYQWTKISGPSVTIGNPNSASSPISNLVAGTYQFELKVTDNQGGVGKDTVSVTVNPASNTSPIANAGSDKTLTLPTNTITLSGSGSDADGSIKSYQWTKVSGPSSYKIASTGAAVTDVTELIQGVYLFELTVTDNKGATAKDTMQVTVAAPANIPPTANAGKDQTVILPLNSASLTGNGTDPDGSIKGYQWKKIAGPTIFDLLNSILNITNVSGLVEGTYQFELTVTDNQGATGKDTVQVQVDAISNTPPTADAGSAITITLPVNSTTLTGSGSDADGSVKSYQWKKVSGPSSYKIASPGAAETDITGLVQGTYQFELTVTDDQGSTGKDTVQVQVNAASNTPPTADAGSGITITLPVNTTTLTGSGADADGSIKGYQWKKISGPSSYKIASPQAAVTDLTGLAQGTYQFELTVTDDQGSTGKDTVQVQVNAASNIPPTADAGSGITITLPTNTITLSGSGSDADGSIKSYQWTKVAGPSSFSIANPAIAVTGLSGLVQGTYQFELTVTDDQGATGKDTVQVRVNAASNTSPTADAGSGITVTLPINTATLTGSGSDADGSIKSYQWTKVSGPSSFSIENPAIAVTGLSGLAQGTYLFELTVTDDQGATGEDTVQVRVNAAANTPPTADAGSGITITLPINTATLTGSGSDADGSIKSYQWTKVSGPSSFSIANPAIAVTGLSELVQGTYQFELIVTDDKGAVGKDTLQVQVNAPLNIPPTANAGSNKTITLPADTTMLTGSATDAGGTIKSYEWTKISGPSSYNITDATSPVTEISGLVQGIYYFELTVTDDGEAIGKDTVQVRVKAASNIPPTADAGEDQTITLPINTTTLTGSGSDTDGSIKSYKWTKISGPSAYNIANSTSPVTDISGLIQGTYKFRLEVTDDKGDIGQDIVLVIVNAEPNISPTADAGADQTITLPTNTASLTGTGSDPDGSIKSYKWTKISGPSSYNVVNPASPTTDVSDLQQGTYQFELEVTDDKGVTDQDTVQVRVNAASNLSPTADAGSDKTITLPANLTTLSGSGSDRDGTVKSYRWKKISGPTPYNLVNASFPETEVSGLTQGTYQFELTVTDDEGATGRDTVQVKVNTAANVPPTANAGTDKTVTLPSSIATLTGSGNDADGTIKSYQWAMISGPGSYNLVNAKSPVTDVSGLVQGIYWFELEVTDDKGDTGQDTVQITVNAESNTAPTANAGTAKTITMPTNIVTLTGAGSDFDGTIKSYQWTKISGPSAFSIVNSKSPVTDVSGLVQGVYLFELEVTDDKGAKGKDTVQVRVNAASNIAPTANAGPDKTITLPTNTASLTGTGNDPDGSIKSYKWTKISGPSSFDIVNSSSEKTNITGLVEGAYRFELTVTDNKGDTGQDTVIIKVNAAPNKAPVANAGSDKTITLPTNSTTLSGSGSDTDGSIKSYQWAKVSGPSSYKIADAGTAVTNITELVQGTYQFEFTVTDDKGSADRDTVQVRVNPGQSTTQSTPNVAPEAKAGNDTTVVAPVDFVTLTGSGVDPDGSIAGYLWNQISGPSSSAILSNNTAVTNVNNLVEGTYSFELEVTDNKGLKGKDTVNITVALSRLATVSNSVKVYPNPVHDITTLEINTGKANTNLMVIISDMTGRIVYRKQFVSTRDDVKERINMGYLVKGTYIVTVLFDGMEKQSVKVIRM